MRDGEYYSGKIQSTFERVVERPSDERSGKHFGACDDISVFVIPVISVTGNEFNNSNTRIIFAFGEPGFDYGDRDGLIRTDFR